MPRAESAHLGVVDPVACSPRAEGGQGAQIFSPQAPTPVQMLNLLRGRAGRMQRPGLPKAGQPPHPPTSSGHRLGKDRGHQVATGMHHREQCPAEASFPDPTEREPSPLESGCPCLCNCLSVCASHTHTPSLRHADLHGRLLLSPGPSPAHTRLSPPPSPGTLPQCHRTDPLSFSPCSTGSRLGSRGQGGE